MLIQNKDQIEFVTKFPCFLGHPVHKASVREHLFIIKGKLQNTKTII